MSKTPKPKRQGKKITSVLVNVKEHELTEFINALSDNLITISNELGLYSSEPDDHPDKISLKNKFTITQGLYARAKKLQEKFEV